MNRVLPSVIQSRHGAYLGRWYREHEQYHNDGVNRLVVQFAREGVEAVGGWRGEINVPGLTQVRPDLIVMAIQGPFGKGAYCIEFERRAVQTWQVVEKLGPYRRMANIGRPLPLLMACETEQGRQNFGAASGALPMLTATLERALSGPVTGAATVWDSNGVSTALHCRRRKATGFVPLRLAVRSHRGFAERCFRRKQTAIYYLIREVSLGGSLYTIYGVGRTTPDKHTRASGPPGSKAFSFSKGSHSSATSRENRTLITAEPPRRQDRHVASTHTYTSSCVSPSSIR